MMRLGIRICMEYFWFGGVQNVEFKIENVELRVESGENQIADYRLQIHFVAGCGGTDYT